jgi:hypothetical protein
LAAASAVALGLVGGGLSLRGGVAGGVALAAAGGQLLERRDGLLGGDRRLGVDAELLGDAGRFVPGRLGLGGCAGGQDADHQGAGGGDPEVEGGAAAAQRRAGGEALEEGVRGRAVTQVHEAVSSVCRLPS